MLHSRWIVLSGNTRLTGLLKYAMQYRIPPRSPQLLLVAVAQTALAGSTALPLFLGASVVTS